MRTRSEIESPEPRRRPLLRPSEHPTGYRELKALEPLARLSEKGEHELFWETHKEEIAKDLKERFRSDQTPAVEVVIPVHKNGPDMPFLLSGLSKQHTTDLGSVRLALVMHNNAGNEGYPRDSSWDQVEYLEQQGVPLRVVEFTDRLLTGPYVSWQYCLFSSEAPITAVLDADSIPPPQWLHKMVAPLIQSERDKSTVVCTGSLRQFFGLDEKIIHTLSRAQLLAIDIKIMFAPPGPNLVVGGRFTGGQAAYRTEMATDIIRNWGGMPQGDLTFAKDLLQKYGDAAFLYCDAPVLNKADRNRNTQELHIKLLRAARIFVPKRFHKYMVKEQDRELNELATLSRYIPWTRPLIAAFTSQGKLSAKEYRQVLVTTATSDGFAVNEHVQHFLQQHAFSDCPDASALLQELLAFAREAVMPTFSERIAKMSQ